MKKMPCLFEREFVGSHDFTLLKTVNPGCEWVLQGQGIATRKYDGTAAAIISEKLYARLDCKRGKQPPPGAIPCCEPDTVTGHWPHWVLADRPEDRWIREAFENSCACVTMCDGTYEAIGPKINSNHEHALEHVMVRHGADVLAVPDRSWDGIREFLSAQEIEGIVFHHPDGRMVKIRRHDYGFAWPVPDK
jgi:hypothetical protein